MTGLRVAAPLRNPPLVVETGADEPTLPGKVLNKFCAEVVDTKDNAAAK